MGTTMTTTDLTYTLNKPLWDYLGILPKPDHMVVYNEQQRPNISERHYQLDDNTILVLTESQELDDNLFYGLYLFRGNIANTLTTDKNIWTDRYFELTITDRPAVVSHQLEQLLHLYQYRYN